MTKSAGVEIAQSPEQDGHRELAGTARIRGTPEPRDIREAEREFLAKLREDRKRENALRASAPQHGDTRKYARVFMTGRSQAVRLPKEFRFDVDRVLIRREGRHVILSPPFKDWDDYLENGLRLSDDFPDPEELDADLLPLEEREPFD